MHNGYAPAHHATLNLLSCSVALAIVGALSFPHPLQAQSDNFNSGTAANWMHYDVGNIGSAYGVPGLGATYTFPADGSGGFAYRISSPPDAPFDKAPYGFGPSRALTFRPANVYSGRFSLGVDVLAWNNAIDQAFGPVWFVQTPGPGTSAGYSLTWEPAGQEILISRITSEAGTTVGRKYNVVLDPTQRYRFFASSHDGTTFLGQIFNVNDPQNPVAGVVAADSLYNAGICGLMLYDGTSPSIAGADATFDNYAAAAPAANTLPATVSRLTPFPGLKSTAVYPTVSAAILDRDTSVDPTSLQLWMDGVQLPSAQVTIDPTVTEADNPGGYQTIFPGATISYAVTNLLPWNSVHTNRVVFRDSTGSWQTFTWSWTVQYPYLSPANGLPLGSFPTRGWDVRMVWTNGVDLGNSLARAEQQLALPPRIPCLVTTQTVSQVLNWNDAGNGTDPQLFGYFLDPALVSNVPGLAPDGSHNNIACEMFAYLELTAGVHRFGAKSDDGFRLASGSSLRDPNATILGLKDGSTFDGTFDFVVGATALYPVRCVWYENGGSAIFELFSVSLDDPNARLLLNDPTDPADSVKAFLPLRLVSAPTINGPYTTAPNASIDTVLKTVTVPKSAAAQFYRMQTVNPVTLTGITVSGSQVLITYR